MKKITFEEFVSMVYDNEDDFALSFNSCGPDDDIYGRWYGVQRIETAMDFDILVFGEWGTCAPEPCHAIIRWEATREQVREWLNAVLDLYDIDEIWLED